MNGRNVIRPLVWFSGLVLVAALGAGCGEDPVSGDPGTGTGLAEMSIDLDRADGGLAPTAEEPGFGDSYFSSFLSENGEIDVTGDPLATDARILEMERNRDAKVFYLRMVWGNHRRSPDVVEFERDDLVDWTGGAGVSEGVILPLRTIRFERNDFLILPWRQDEPTRSKVGWVSHTGPGRDGLLVKIVVPAPNDVSLSAEETGAGDGLTEDDRFVFRTAALQVEFPLADVADLDTTLMVDDVNGVTFTGFDRDDLDDFCPRGYMMGAWVRVRNDDRQGGYFRAAWTNVLGRVTGHLRGRWGVTEDGRRLFVGKIIGRNGSYLGHLRGEWEPGNAAGQGTYRGRWEIHRPDAVAPQLKGGVLGRWGVSDRIEHGGFLRGVWKANCNRAGTDAEGGA
jgi:hypothetical protein